jgi:hypothetical protein
MGSLFIHSLSLRGGPTNVRIFHAFLLAWNEAACQRNILAGFRSSGICPLDRLQPLNNHHTRKVIPDEMLMDTREDPPDIGSCLLSSIESLSYLDSKPKRVFADNDRVLEMSAQWEKISCFPVAHGTFLSGPSQFLWSVKLHNPQAGEQNLHESWHIDGLVRIQDSSSA